MAMKDYYEPFFTQELVRVPTVYPPPYDWIWEMGDGEEFVGLYIVDNSQEVRIASAQGIKVGGRFVVDPDVPIKDGDVVRRVSDDVYFRIIGEPKISPKQARSQVKLFQAQITEK